MIVQSLPLGPVMANTYILSSESNGYGAVIDVGECNESLLSHMSTAGIKDLKYILLTHGHFDHIDGVYDLKNHFPSALVCIHENDAKCLEDDLLSLARGFGMSAREKVKPDKILHDGDVLPFGTECFTVIHTPGHTKGGVTYMIDNCLFTGDTLFRSSVGRTDFPGGNFSEIDKSVNRLFDLPGDFNVYPGHGAPTTLDYERHNNMYVKWRNPR